MKQSPFELFLKVETEQQTIELQDWMNKVGYSLFYDFLESFKKHIQKFRDEEAEQMKALVAKANRILPNPGAISPSWTYIWDKLDNMINYKVRVLQAIPQDDRSGDWQVLIDNPSTNREVACYPGLTFYDAAYVYAQFRPELEKNEYIRMQKIQTHITEFGERQGVVHHKIVEE
ncbi:MAG: hypothetical protein WDZ91_12960 [Paenibacillaceae bacterium]